MKHWLRVSAIATLVVIAGQAPADDIEVFRALEPAAAPNILLIVDRSGSMFAKIHNKKKINIMKDSIEQTLLKKDAEGRYKDLNIGIMDFAENTGGIDFPVAPLNDPANNYRIPRKGFPSHWRVGDGLRKIVNDYTKSGHGNTEIVPALYEAYLYFAQKGWPRGWPYSERKDKGWNGWKFTGDWDAVSPASYEKVNTDNNKVSERTLTIKYCYKGGTDLRQCSLIDPHEFKKDGNCWEIKKKQCSKNSDGGSGCKYTVKKDSKGKPIYGCRYFKFDDVAEKSDKKYRRSTSACQDDYIVLFSDGAPTHRQDKVNDVIALFSGNNEETLDWDKRCPKTKEWWEKGANEIPWRRISWENRTSAACGPELASMMTDPDGAERLGLPFGNPVKKIYTIGFDLKNDPFGEKYLRFLASEGRGAFYSAGKASELVAAFEQVLDDINKRNTSFVAPSFTLSRANRLELDTDIYLTMFEPSSRTGWPGNVKGYQISHDAILDLNGTVAIDENGHFVNTAQSYWTDEQDGDAVTRGGLAMRIDGNRRVYTYTGVDAPNKVDLATADNSLNEDNTSITNALLGLSAATNTSERKKLLRWARGLDAYDKDGDGDTSEMRSDIMGAPLHSAPVVLMYKTGGQERKVLFTMNNNGFLHAFDVTKKRKDANGGGNELFAFIPQALLKNLAPLSKDGYGDYIYGLDGHLVGWRQDDDHAYLFFGMRRGGNNYYALDVSDPERPKLMWRIEGGKGDFAQLGESWSRPSVVWTKVQGSERVALIFGGGYDEAEDLNSVRTKDATGAAVYAVDAMTGERLWWAGRGGDLDMPLDYAIPSDIRVVDLDGNGYLDRLYFGDMGGQLWRIDIDEDNIEGKALFYTRLADINDDTVAGNRRFYYPPSVGLMQHDGKRYLAVAIGSGYRAHPVSDNVEDRFYLFMDPDVTVGEHDADDFAPIQESALYDATTNAIGEDASVTAAKALEGKHGWYLRLEHPGEKVLASSLIFDGRLFFNSYQPKPRDEGVELAKCTAGESQGRAYILNLKDATPAIDMDGDGKKVRTERYIDLVEQTIPPEPKVVFTHPVETQSSTMGGGNSGGTSGTEKEDEACTNFTDFWSGRKRITGDCTTIHRTYWNEDK